MKVVEFSNSCGVSDPIVLACHVVAAESNCSGHMKIRYLQRCIEEDGLLLLASMLGLRVGAKASSSLRSQTDG